MSSFLEDFAAALGGWLEPVIPGIQERTFAVSEVDAFTEANMPRLPLGFVGAVSQTYDSFPNGVMLFVAEIVLDPIRIQSGECDTPFWAYYDVDAVRDCVYVGLAEVEHKWGRITPVQVEVESSKLAVHIALTFQRRIVWRHPEECAPPQQCGPREPPTGIRLVVQSAPVADPYCKPPCTKQEEERR